MELSSDSAAFNDSIILDVHLSLYRETRDKQVLDDKPAELEALTESR